MVLRRLFSWPKCEEVEEMQDDKEVISYTDYHIDEDQDMVDEQQEELRQ